MKKKSLRKILQNGKRKNAGITLIALVLTIVILIILATITINFAFGENGLVSMTEDARDITTEATEKEGIEMAVADSKIKDITTPDREKENLEESLRSQFGNDVNFTVTENGEGSFLITMNDSQRSYYVESTGEIIAQSEWIEIGTAEELKAFRDEVNSGNTFEGQYIRLTSDITLDINEEWEPIGYYYQNSEDTSIKDGIHNENHKPFSGIFDGQGHTVDYMKINNSKYGQGLFGLVDSGEIKNINLGENCSLNMQGVGCGGIVGIVRTAGEIYNCNNYADMEQTIGGVVGTIVGSVTVSNCKNYGELTNAMGGIVGASNGGDWEEYKNQFHTIINCGNYGNVSKSIDGAYVGGIVGYFQGTISNSFNSGTVSMNANEEKVGGITGSIDGNILNCSNEGNVNSNANKVGGITGSIHSEGIIDQCFNKGQVNGNENVGGIVGYEGENIKNCYNTGIVTGTRDVGGIVGRNEGKVSNCYNIGKISGDTRVGGIVGLNNSYNSPSQNLSVRGTIRNTYSLDSACEDLCGQNNTNGDGAIIENSSIKTEQEMKSLAPTLGSAFKDDYEEENINDGYPILSWQ